MVILDSDLMTILGWSSSSQALVLGKRFLNCHPENDIATTIITFEEQVRGWMAVLLAQSTLKDEGTNPNL